MVTEQIDNPLSTTAVELWNTCYKDSSEKELLFYLEQVIEKSPLQGSTLEINCGSGQFLLPLLKKGHMALGLETDKYLLQLLQKNAAASKINAEILQVSFNEFEPRGAFTNIVALNTIQYILEEETLLALFKHAFDHLASGGNLLFNFTTPFAQWNSKQWVKTETYPFEDGFGRIETTITPLNRFKGTATVQKYCMVKKSGAPLFDYTTQTERFYTLTELMLLLENVGFTEIRVHADCKKIPVSEESIQGNTLYTIAQKP